MAVVEERYAGALLELGISENSTARYLEEVTTLKTLLIDNKELLEIYTNPKITLEEKLELTEKCFGNDFTREVVGLLTLVIRNGRSASLMGIIDCYISRAKDYLKIGIVNVESASGLDDTQKAALEKKILQTTDYTTLEMHYSVDESLIGGMIVRIKDRIIDNSIKTKLDGMARELRQVQL